MSNYNWDLLTEKTKEQSQKIGENPQDWATLFSALGFECVPALSSVLFDCPKCLTSTGRHETLSLTPKPGSGGYATWRCRHHNLTRQYFGSHIGLLRYLHEQKTGESLKVWDAYHLIRKVWEKINGISKKQPQKEYAGIPVEDSPF